MSKHILLVDDDTLMRRSLAFGLSQAGYRVSSAANAEDALQMARRDPPDLILLDIGLPGMDGLSALQYFKDQTQAPVIFLTARWREPDEILGLELGADDYITKPANLDLLLARVKAALRRMETAKPPARQLSPLTVGDLTLDPRSHTVTLGGHPIELTPREFELLHTFALKPGNVISTDELLATVWGAEFAGQAQVVYVHIRWLRKKVEADPENPKRIVTVHGIGYKLEASRE